MFHDIANLTVPCKFEFVYILIFEETSSVCLWLVPCLNCLSKLPNTSVVRLFHVIEASSVCQQTWTITQRIKVFLFVSDTNITGTFSINSTIHLFKTTLTSSAFFSPHNTYDRPLRFSLKEKRYNTLSAILHFVSKDTSNEYLLTALQRVCRRRLNYYRHQQTIDM